MSVSPRRKILKSSFHTHNINHSQDNHNHTETPKMKVSAIRSQPDTTKVYLIELIN